MACPNAMSYRYLPAHFPGIQRFYPLMAATMVTSGIYLLVHYRESIILYPRTFSLSPTGVRPKQLLTRYSIVANCKHDVCCLPAQLFALPFNRE